MRSSKHLSAACPPGVQSKPPKYVQLFLEINIRPNLRLIVAVYQGSERKWLFIAGISICELSSKLPSVLLYLFYLLSLLRLYLTWGIYLSTPSNLNFTFKQIKTKKVSLFQMTI